MVNLGPSLRAFLDADTGVAALLAGRIYPLKAPQKPSFPLLLWRWSYSVESDLENGKLCEATLECSAVAGDYDAAHAVADAVELALHGQVSDVEWGEAIVRHILLEGRDDEIAQLASDEIIFAATSRFGVMFE